MKITKESISKDSMYIQNSFLSHSLQSHSKYIVRIYVNVATYDWKRPMYLIMVTQTSFFLGNKLKVINCRRSKIEKQTLVAKDVTLEIFESNGVSVVEEVKVTTR
jgi:hypothetical protein